MRHHTLTKGVYCSRKRKEHDNERVIQMEKGTFTAIVMSTFRSVGIEADRQQVNHLSGS